MTAAPPVAAAIRLENVTLSYDRHPAVHHLTGRFAAGALTAVVGPNGAGKSTLLRALAGARPVQEGRIDRCGLAVERIAYLPQQAALDRAFPIAALDVVMLGALRRVGLFRRVPADLAARAREALTAVGLAGFERRPIATLSAGQFQRVLFARVLLQDAPVVLLDEPFTAIDARTTADLMALLRRWRDEKRTVIAVLHDLDMVRAGFDEALLLAREQVSWGPVEEVLTARNQLRARAMAEAWAADPALCDRAA